MSTIGTGTVVQIGGRTIITGSASGIDTSALVDAAYQQRLAQATKLADKITINENKAVGYESLRSLLEDVQTSLDTLRQTYGSSTTSSSAFNQKAGTLASSTATDPATLLSVGLTSSAVAGDYEVEIVTKATAHKVRGTDIADKDADLGYTGTFDIGLTGGASVSINVTATMSLQEVATAINAQSTTSRVSASVVKISDTAYQLVLTGMDTAKDIVTSSTGGDDVLNLVGVTDGVGGFNNLVTAAVQAEVVIDGITIFRDNNSFSDAVDGIQFNILKAEAGNTMTLTVTEDYSSVKEDILAFVESYNAYRDYVSLNQTVGEEGVVSEDAVLFGDFTLKSIDSELQRILSGTFSNDAEFTNLRSIGFRFDSSNKIVLEDEAKLDTAILEDFDSVRALFETQFESDNAEFDLLANTGTFAGGNLVFDITHDGANITDVSVNGDNTMFDIVGTSIVGKVGTIYEGMRFAYVGTTSVTVNFSFEQGIADLFSNAIERYADPLTGDLLDRIAELGDTNKELADRTQRITERAEEFRNRLIEKYARFEQQIAAAKALLAQLRAILGTDKNDDR